MLELWFRQFIDGPQAPRVAGARQLRGGRLMCGIAGIVAAEDRLRAERARPSCRACADVIA